MIALTKSFMPVCVEERLDRFSRTEAVVLYRSLKLKSAQFLRWRPLLG